MNEENANVSATNDTVLANSAVSSLINKLNEAGRPFAESIKGRLYRGIKTGFNKAFVINAATRDQLVAADANSVELIRPWLRGRDLRTWQAQPVNQYLIMIPSSANHEWPWSKAETETDALQRFQDSYPAIYAHFMSLEEQVRQRHDHGKFFWELRSCAYYAEFAKPKIVYPETSKWMRAGYDTTGAVCANTVYILPTEDLYWLAILQSRIFDWYARQVFQTAGNPWSCTGRVRFLTSHLEQFPLFPATAEQRVPIIERVEALLADNTLNQLHWRDEIDGLLFDLYHLTDQERTLIQEAEKLHSATAKYAGILADVPDDSEEEVS